MTDTPAPGDPGPLLAQGRDAEIFDLGDGTVLRRARNERPLTEEARVMEWVVDHGYPCPRVHELRAGDTEMVMMVVRRMTMRRW